MKMLHLIATGVAFAPSCSRPACRQAGVTFASFNRPACRPVARATVRLQAAEDDEELDRVAMQRLRERISRIQEGGGLATSAQAYFDIATEKPPQLLLRDFFQTTSPRVQQAMQDAVVSLLGALPSLQFDATVSTTGDKLAALMLQLQMTGYMLRNAEYVTKLRELLNIRTRSIMEFRTAFDRRALHYLSSYLAISCSRTCVLWDTRGTLARTPWAGRGCRPPHPQPRMNAWRVNPIMYAVYSNNPFSLAHMPVPHTHASPSPSYMPSLPFLAPRDEVS